MFICDFRVFSALCYLGAKQWGWGHCGRLVKTCEIWHSSSGQFHHQFHQVMCHYLDHSSTTNGAKLDLYFCNRNLWPMLPILEIKVLLESLDLAEFNTPYDIIFHHIGCYGNPSKVFTGHQVCPLFTKIDSDHLQVKAHKSYELDFWFSRTSVRANQN